MNYIMYLDVLFLINMGMNLVILRLTGYLCRQRIVWWRYLVGAGMGSMLVVTVIWLPVFPPWQVYIGIYGGIGAGMCWLTFQPKTIRGTLKCYGCLLTVAFLLGGIMNWLYFSTPVGEWLNRVFGSEGLQFGEIVVLVLMGGTLFLLLSTGARRLQQEQERDCFQVSLYFDDETNLYGVGLVDTGNFLREPVTGQPVMVAEAEWIQSLLPPPYLKVLNTYMTEDRIDYDRIMNENLTKCRWIPYQSVGETRGELLGLQCRKIILRNDKYCLVREAVMIGISRTPIMGNRQYQILLQSEILEGEKICCR